MQWFKAFISGFLATLIFHQGLFGLLYLAGAVPQPPFNLDPVPPLGVPAVISLAFFGGLWGLPVWALIRGKAAGAYWSIATVFGALGPTAVAMLVVFPLKDLPVSAQTWVGGLILNGAWGMGVGVFMKGLARTSNRP
ncbi:MAG: hypothetical protein ACQES2_03780 [Pseudomonadota bacterium]